jgi:hypothetical protein
MWHRRSPCITHGYSWHHARGRRGEGARCGDANIRAGCHRRRERGRRRALSCAGDAGDATGPLSNVVLEYRGKTVTFDRAYFGYRIEGGQRTGLYFEVARGGDGKCPTEASPTPKQIFTIDKIHAAATGTFTKEDGVEIRFFDFEGSLREVRPDFADISRVEVVTLDTDAGTSTANVEFTFSSDGGTPENRAHGTLSATYCASFDEEVAP